MVKEDVLTELDLPEDVEYQVDEYTSVVDVVTDERFADGNIRRFPMNGIEQPTIKSNSYKRDVM